MSKLKALVLVVLILSFAGLFGYYLYLNNNRYEILKSERGIAYELDKRTGKSWIIIGEEKKPHKKFDDIEIPQTIPVEEQEKITGSASISYRFFKGNLYNGSNWFITEMTVKIEVKEKNGKIRWARSYNTEISLSPLHSDEFIFEILGDDKNGEMSWGIENIKGYLPE